MGYERERTSLVCVDHCSFLLSLPDFKSAIMINARTEQIVWCPSKLMLSISGGNLQYTGPNVSQNDVKGEGPTELIHEVFYLSFELRHENNLPLCN